MARHSSKSKSKPKKLDPRRDWLIAQYPTFLIHQANKTANQFFPSLYEEYFAKWNPTPTEQQISQAGGNVEIATATVRQTEERVRDFEWRTMIAGELITLITYRRSTV